jgi:sugar fermentation stimulation protein A
MLGCLGAGWPVQLSLSDNTKRKYRHTWELVHNGRCWIGINTARNNSVVEEGIRSGAITELADCHGLRREVRLGDRSRIDFALEHGDRRTWIEIKSVTMVDSAGRFAFPDAVTSRGARHLRELTTAVEAGDRAMMLYLIQRADGDCFSVADDIDPAYGEELRRAVSKGVEVVAYRANVSPEEIRVAERVEVNL